MTVCVGVCCRGAGGGEGEDCEGPAADVPEGEDEAAEERVTRATGAHSGL